MTEVLVRRLASKISSYVGRVSNLKVISRIQTKIIPINKSSTGNTSLERDPCAG
jgi:hypothetical protein